MRWRANTDGDTRIVKGFLFRPRAMQAPMYNHNGSCLSREKEARWLERTAWRQKYSKGFEGWNRGWVDISWEKK